MSETEMEARMSVEDVPEVASDKRCGNENGDVDNVTSGDGRFPIDDSGSEEEEYELPHKAMFESRHRRRRSSSSAIDSVTGRRRSSMLLRPSICSFDGSMIEVATNDIKQEWWKHAVVYQVYWRSFFDSNGDGYGDLEGVIQKLDYIQSLGVSIIWLNPFYESPDVDNGYDISDYYAVMQKAGTIETFEKLVKKIHNRKMKIITDLVVNHTSDKHKWFLQSKSSRDSPKRDWYIWKDAKIQNGKKLCPNNYRSYFSPSAWQWDETTEQYYFHSFGVEQPDLNWVNKDVREAIYNMMRWWLDKGVDGFRMDAIALLAKSEIRNATNPDKISYLGNNPGIHEYLQEINKAVFSEYDDVFTVGEIPFVSAHEASLFVGDDRKELKTLFHFQVCDCMMTMDLIDYKAIQAEWYTHLWGKGWNSQFLNNHDHTRQVTRYGNDGKYRIESAKLLATLIHTLPGMPYIYQGEEIGMTGVDYNTIDDYNDIMMKNKYNELIGYNYKPADALLQLKLLSRDNSRSPMQWSGHHPHAGFTTAAKPWIKVNPNYEDINVEDSVKDTSSVFWYYRKLISLRKKHPVMTYGDYFDYDMHHPHVYMYRRSMNDVFWLIVQNHSVQESTEYPLPTPLMHKTKKIVIGNYKDAQKDDESVHLYLRPHEARIYSITMNNLHHKVNGDHTTQF